MKSPGNKLTLREREQLARLLEEQLSNEPMSNEEHRRMGIDRYGETYDLGGSSHGVLVGESGIPLVISEERTKFLDCGHSITSPSQVLGKCDNGHVLCNLHGHNLLRCVECGKLICQLCGKIDKEGNPKCSDHGIPWYGYLVAPTIIALIIFAIAKC